MAKQWRASLHSSKLFQIQAVLLQAFPKKALAVLWDFNGLQASQTLNEVSPNFSSPRLPSAPSPPPPPRRKREDVPLFAGGWLQEGRGAFMVA